MAQGSFIMWNTWRNVNYAALLALLEESVDVSVNVKLASNSRNEGTNEEKWGADVKYYQVLYYWTRVLGRKKYQLWMVGYSIGLTSVYLVYVSPIQYLITFGVKRLSRDDGQCVLTIRQGTYSKRPALLSDIKYWFGKIDLNSSRIKKSTEREPVKRIV